MCIREWRWNNLAVILWAMAIFLVGISRLVAGPNVVLIITDDQGWGDVAIHGNEHIDTPHLDSLAKSGMRLDRFFVSPVCAPTRASLLTGRYHLRTGVHGVTRGQETMRASEYTLGEAFRDNGYRTGYYGKWHNGAHFPHNPNGQGFDDFAGFCAGHWNNYFDTEMEFNGEMRRTEGFMVDVITDEASDFIRESVKADKPFFSCVSINTPHTPWQVPNKYFDKYQGKGLDERAACAFAMVEQLDDCVGRLRSTVESSGVADNTIFIFLTDNGPNSPRFNGGMSGRKGSVHEGGVRVPFFIHWPGMIEGGKVIPNISCHMDVLPTLSSLCGLTIAPEIRASWDGLDLTSLLLQGKNAWGDRIIVQRWGGHPSHLVRVGVRNNQFRAVLENNKWSLFDMYQDPGEKADVSGKYPEILDKLKFYLADWHQDVTRDGYEPIPTEVGHPEIGGKPVVLPGHEALLVPGIGSGIRYNGRNGWANDWVDHWVSKDAWPEWAVKVVNAGEFDVYAEYSAPDSSIGTGLTVEFGNSILKSSISTSFTGKRIHSPDRIERKEVYERTWGLMNLGTIKLEPGSHRLKLKANRSNAEGIVDIKSIQLRKRPVR